MIGVEYEGIALCAGAEAIHPVSFKAKEGLEYSGSGIYWVRIISKEFGSDDVVVWMTWQWYRPHCM